MSPISLWLADYQLLAAALLLGVMLALAALRQPAQRLAVAKSTLAALAALALLCALPGWSLVHLLSDDATIAEPTANSAAPAPAFSATLSTIEPTPDLFNAQPPESPAGGVLHTDSRNKVEPAHPISWSAYLVAAYGAGSAAVTLWLITGALLARRVRQQATPAPRELQELLQQLCAPEKTPPRLLLSDRITAPVALGLRRPTILLPTSTFPIHHSPFPISPSQLLPILAHELAHLQHRDLHTLAATRLLLILLWPQPLYWLLRRTIRLDQETLADAAAADRAGRLDYAQQLLAWASTASTQRPPRLAGAVGLWEGPSQLKRRIAVLLNEQFNVIRSCSTAWRRFCIVSLAFAALSLSLVTLQPSPVAGSDGPTPAAAQLVPALVDDNAGPAEPNVYAGLCVDEHGLPLAGVTVSLYAQEPSLLHESIEPAAVTRTDDAGKFRFEGVNALAKDQSPNDQRKQIWVIAQAKGRATVGGSEMLYFVTKRGKSSLLRMSPAATVTGRITDVDGKPIADAVVTGEFGFFMPNDGSQSRTDADGRYRLDALPSAGRIAIAVIHSDYVLKYFLLPSPQSELDVALRRGAAVTGRVVYQSADPNLPFSPAAGVRVWATRLEPLSSGDQQEEDEEEEEGEADGKRTAITDADGRYELRCLVGGKYDFGASAPDHVTAGLQRIQIGAQGIESDRVGTIEAPDMVLTGGAVLRVQFTEKVSGNLLAVKEGTQAFITLRRTSSTEAGYSIRYPATVNEKSEAEIRLPAGRYTLSALIRAVADDPTWTSPSDKITTASGEAEFIEIKDGETVKVTIPMQSHFPSDEFDLDSPRLAVEVPAPHYSPYRTGTPMPPTPALPIPVAPPEGAAVPLDANPSKDRNIPVEDGANDSSPSPYRDQSTAVNTSKEKSPVKTLNVQVHNRRGEPVVGAVVTPTSFMMTNGSSVWPKSEYPGWAVPKSQTTDAEGRATLAYDLPKQLLALFTPQDLLCSVEHPDYVVVSNHETWKEGTKVYVLDEGAIIEFATTAGGATLPAADSYLLNASGQRKDRDMQVVDGRVRLPRIDAGVREVRAVHIAADDRPLFSQVVQHNFANGKTVRLALPVEPGVRVEGQLDEAVPRPVKHGRVIAVAIPAGDFKPPRNATRPSWSVSATIKEDGTFFLEDLPAGDELKLIALCDGYFAPSQNFPETSDDPQIPWTPQSFPLRDRVNRLTLKMAPTATCEIEARDEKGDPVADAQVVIHTNVTWHLMLNGPYGAAMDSLDRLQGVQSPESRPVEFTAMTNKDGVARITNVASLEPIVYVSVQNANYRLAPISYALPFYGPPVASLALKPGQTARRPVNLVELGK
ncbi:MAG: hypothetical protein JNL18_06905 [Planctomycetaceae bacterium]|nr:hypothetical protein [Planctomycetaceae bacterium]